jgi:hypothetical protein
VTGVFLSYRKIERSYAPMFAHWVLRQRFGDGLVFEAGHQNQPGTYFPGSIEAWLQRCCVLVVFIDPPWLQDLDLLRNPNDWVRKEILHFIQHDKQILPVLVDGARMPRGRQLPAELAPMTKWVGLPMSTMSAHADMHRLVGQLEHLAPDLVLAALDEPVTTAASPVALLRAEHEVFPYRPPPQLADLAEWSRAPHGPKARLITGTSGAGKTRLALRLCAQLRGTGHPAVMVSASATPAALDRLAVATVPFLVVIDDAETRPEMVAAAIRAVAAADTPARVLLLARTGGDWLEGLRDDPDDRIASVLDQTTTETLAAPVPQDDDFATACTALGSRLGLSAPVTAAGLPQPATLLEVQAAALAALIPDEGGQKALWARIAELERSRWNRAAATFGLARLRQASLTELMAAATLFPAVTEPEAEAVIRTLHSFDRATPNEVDAALTLARTMSPGPRSLNPVEPQPLAHSITAQLLRSGHRLTELFAVVPDDLARTAIIALGRCLAAHPDVADAVGIPLAETPTRLLQLTVTALPAVPEPSRLAAQMSAALPHLPTADLDRLTDALPQHSEPLAGFAVEVTRRALEARQAAGQVDDGTARLSRLLATRLAARGGPAEEAIAAALVAVDWFEDGAELAEAHAALALALDLDPASAENARKAGTRAIQLYRALAVDDRTRAALATALINQVHRPPGDGDLAAEAYTILHRLHEAHPQRYRSLFADAIDVLAVLTRDERLGWQALDLRRSLAAARPDSYRPALAATLFNLGQILGGSKEAQALWRESQALFAELATADPQRFGPDLARVQARLAGR